MRREAPGRYIGQQELARGFEAASNVVSVSFTGSQRERFMRSVIVGASENIAFPGIIEFPAKEPGKIINFRDVQQNQRYNPRVRINELHKNVEIRGRDRKRRASRCKTKGPHESGECGSPNCRVPQSMKKYRKSAKRQISVARVRKKSSFQEAAQTYKNIDLF